MNDVLKILVQDAVLDDAAVAKVHEQVSRGVLLEDALRSVASEERVLASLGAYFGVPLADLGAFDAPKEFLSRFPARVLFRAQV